MFGQGGSGKKTTKLERLMRQDHSDVYFDNERLSDDLNNRIDTMQKEMHKHDIQRGIEIKKLKKEIHEARIHQMNSIREEQMAEPTIRPHTAAGHSPTKKTAGPDSRKRAQSAWARTTSQDQSEQSDEDKPPERSETPTSSVSTLRNTKTLRKYKNIGAQCFKENNRFPEEWYVKCLPASDAAIFNARKKKRGKSAPSNLGFLGKIREREQTEKKLDQYTKMNQKLTLAPDKTENMSDNSGVERLSLICDEPVKPVLMSRRRLKEISNVENTVERGPSRNTERHMNIISLNRIESSRIYSKVQTFCKEIEDLKLREVLAMKEREEAVKREAEEKQYAKAIEAAKAREQKKEDNSDDDDDSYRFARWR